MPNLRSRILSIPFKSFVLISTFALTQITISLNFVFVLLNRLLYMQAFLNNVFFCLFYLVLNFKKWYHSVCINAGFHPISMLVNIAVVFIMYSTPCLSVPHLTYQFS